jgi:chemotaxis protein MotA
MDPGVIIGVVVAFGAILGGNIMEGGHTEALVGIPAFVIVIGGTVGAVIVQFPLPLIGGAVKESFKLFKKPPDQAATLVEECVNLAQLARKEGVLGLEKVAEQASHPLLKKGILMAVDGCDSEVIRSTLETAMAQDEEHTTNCAKVWEAGGGYSPTVGIIGAVLGLIHVMQNLTDIEAVGKGIATAFVATIYGVAAANIFFLPLAGRIKTNHMVATRDGELILSGILAIQAGLNPKIVRERLMAYIATHH